MADATKLARGRDDGGAEGRDPEEYRRRLGELADARADVARAERLHRPASEVIELRRRSLRAWLSAEACRRTLGNSAYLDRRYAGENGR